MPEENLWASRRAAKAGSSERQTSNQTLRGEGTALTGTFGLFRLGWASFKKKPWPARIRRFHLPGDGRHPGGGGRHGGLGAFLPRGGSSGRVSPGPAPVFGVDICGIFRPGRNFVVDVQ